MASFLRFFAEHLIWFILGAVVSFLALIGYFVENGFRGKQIATKTIKVDRPTQETLDVEEIKNNVAAMPNQSLNQMVKKTEEVLETPKEDPQADVPVNELPQVNTNQPVSNLTEYGYDRPLMEDDTPSGNFNG